MTNNDLNQISQILDQKLKPIQQELQQHGKMLEGNGKQLEGHGKMLKSLKKDQNTILNMLDKEQMDQRKRLKRVEEHLSLTSSF
jgi:septal ring factor EnvC (AmiA/AmiB activator)